jgi:acetyl/propionyl-CoA carboxylase alpha subunit
LARVSDRPGPATATSIGDRVYRVEHDGRSDVVYVAGTPADRWIFWNGRVFRGDFREPGQAPAPGPGASRHPYALTLTSPIPARVSRIAAPPGTTVRKGDTVLVLDAMKMELPVRAPSNATVKAVHCREGDLVEADAIVAELE